MNLGSLMVFVAAVPMATVTWCALIGLGMARHGDPLSVAAAASVMQLLPPLLASIPAWVRRRSAFWSVLLVWSAALFLILPVYFPGERREAVATGLAVFLRTEDDALARGLAARLPDDPEAGAARLEAARPVPVEVVPAGPPLDNHEIALPYDGEGRRLSVPVVFQHGSASTETYMMFDTGATYTTLPSAVLERLGVQVPMDAPVLNLTTANGPRTAQVVLLDKVWLGDLFLEGVAITTCEDCASSDSSGLLGLNVAGAFNVMIDADRREVIFTRRVSFDRHLDIRPFTDLDARFTRFPGGRVELSLDVANAADRGITKAEAKVECAGEAWLVDVDAVEPGGSVSVRKRLPPHDACDAYQISLERAWW